MPSGTRRASTHTVQVGLLCAPGATGTGSSTVAPTVPQSIPSAPMMCVPKVTDPERTAVPPESRKVTVTFWHHRLSVSSVTGSPQERSAGAVVRLGAGAWPGEAAGGVVRPSGPPWGRGVPGLPSPVGAGAGTGGAERGSPDAVGSSVRAAEPVPRGASRGAPRPSSPSSGTRITDPDGAAAVGPPGPAPTAV
ncbi:hypothetical protein SHL15_3639 [Streptomyces hygroscopicus subsp. limoneus]|nr:hypothetical protein SHL15_3639 [Streptomyces hygroscopicus subsp. limoneus]